MEQYIKKSALVAKIQDKINKIDLNSIEDWRCRIQREHDIEVMKNILSLINTLEVKEVNEVDIPVSHSLTEEGVFTFKDGSQAIITKID